MRIIIAALLLLFTLTFGVLTIIIFLLEGNIGLGILYLVLTAVFGGVCWLVWPKKTN